MAEERQGSFFIFRKKKVLQPNMQNFFSHICLSLMKIPQRHSPSHYVSSFPHKQTESRCLCQLKSVVWIQEIRGKTTFKNKREEPSLPFYFECRLCPCRHSAVCKLNLSTQVQQCDNNSGLNKGNLFCLAPWNGYWPYKNQDHWKDDCKGTGVWLW